MARPKLHEQDKHEQSFRIRLRDDDAKLIRALARRLDQPPAVVLRTLIRQQIEARALRDSNNKTAA